MTSDELYQTLSELGLEKLRLGNGNYMACCPFHEETRPSWGISVEHPHIYGCFGCGAKGNLHTLLSALSNKSQKVIRALCAMGDADKRLATFEDYKPAQRELSEEELFPFVLAPRALFYLFKRGIPFDLAKRAGCLYDHTQDRVLFPWRINGQLVGLTGRSIKQSQIKTLPYFNTKKGSLLYLPFGKLEPMTLVLVEGEIDALKVVKAGWKNVAACSFGRFTDAQALMILKAGVRDLVIFTDNDETGEFIKSLVQDKLGEHLSIYITSYDNLQLDSPEKLDPGSLTTEQIQKILFEARRSWNWFGL